MAKTEKKIRYYNEKQTKEIKKENEKLIRDLEKMNVDVNRVRSIYEQTRKFSLIWKNNYDHYTEAIL